jgi:MFS family permease
MKGEMEMASTTTSTQFLPDGTTVRLKRTSLAGIFACCLVIDFFFLASVLLPGMFRSFPNLPQSTVMLVITLPSFISIVACMCMGPILLKVDRKYAMIFGVFLQLLSATAILISDGKSFLVLIIASAVSGLVFGIVFTAANSAITEYDSPERVRKDVGKIYAFVSAGNTVIMFIGGHLAENGHWPHAYWTFLITIPIVLFALFSIPRMPAIQRSVAVASESRSQLSEERVQGSVLSLALVCAAFFFFLIGIFSFVLSFSTYIITAHHLGNEAQAGMMGVFMSLGGFLGALFVGKLTSIFGRYMLTVGCVLNALMYSALVFFPNLGLLYAFGLLNGATTGSCNAFGLVVASKSIRRAPVAIGIYSTLPGIAALLSPTLLEYGKIYLGADVTSNLWMGAISVTIGAVISVIAMNRAERTQVPSSDLLPVNA